MTDPAIIEATARALLRDMARQRLTTEMTAEEIDGGAFIEAYDEFVANSRQVLAMLPLIAATALERAAKLAEDRDPFGPSPIAAAIRALKQEAGE
jgi:hypothetical protein